MSKLAKWVATRLLQREATAIFPSSTGLVWAQVPTFGPAAEFQRLLREGAFVDQQVAVLRQVDQPVARRGIAGEDHRFAVDGIKPQAETG